MIISPKKQNELYEWGDFTDCQKLNGYMYIYLHLHPFNYCKWLIAMVSKSPNWGYSPSKLAQMAHKWGDTNYLLTGMIPQAGENWQNLP